MSKKVDDTLIPVPVGLLAQLKAMSAFRRYKTMSFEKVWDDIDGRCEEVEDNLSAVMNMVANSRIIFEVEKTEGVKEAEELVNEMMAKTQDEEGKMYMALIAKTLQKLNKRYEEENDK
ncbi:hypothetical protein PND19_01135 [Ligilactobacillus ruminis]|uniref:hypothetical protein n=1 Tax=Ligilactobacillus ruminis TaxID=1623 RepID=UPI00232F299F|nr:hypothetical protein [Ligilactobacillus ruminis]MDB7641241.1 hypothetical protein [Ligilactobacillus ruminis]MDB7646155.1 hypothetical protein [Ligilactobacillus ruminis]